MIKISVGLYSQSIQDLTIVTMTFRIILAVLCGGMIGLERGKSDQPAGMRTYMLVSLGACIVMITGEFVFYKFETGDPARLGAQVISGIGFLGAGSIMVSGKMRIRGLTTAAGLWTSACIGLVIGIGFFEFKGAVISLLNCTRKNREELLMELRNIKGVESVKYIS